ncbi:winged helix-turn-helix transcriptional regulator, partial [uncultured Parasutterella sp.]
MDKFDREILSILVENGKIQLSELSKMTDLSVSSCQRRIKNLEETGIISKYQAVVNEKAV